MPEDYEQEVLMMGNYGGEQVQIACDADGSILIVGFTQDSIAADDVEARVWDVSLNTIVNNLNRIRYMIVTITGEAWGTASNSIAAIWAKFHATTGHAHTGAADDAPILHHGGLSGLTDDDHVRYFDKDGSKPLTGTYITRNVDDGYLSIIAGTAAGGKGATFWLSGKDAGYLPGTFSVYVPNAAGDTDIEVLRIEGLTTTPLINALTRRIINVTDPTAAQDAATKNYMDAVGQAWAAYIPTAVWSGTTPASPTISGRWTRVGRIVTFVAIAFSNDSNGSSLVSLTLPVNIGSSAIEYTPLAAWEQYSNSYTPVNPLAYISRTNNIVSFLGSVAAPDGTFIRYVVSGSYEVA